MLKLNGLAFLSNGRTASSSIRAALREQCGFQKKGGCHVHGSFFYEGLQYFTFARNHWDAVASYAAMIGWDPRERGRLDPDKLEPVFRRMPIYFSNGGHRSRKDIPHLWYWIGTHYNPVVLRYEELPYCLENYLITHGVVIGELPRINHTHVERNGIPYQDFHSPSSRQWVLDKWGQEIEELGYSYEELT